MNSKNLYLEIGQTSLQILQGEQGLELSLERQPDGRLTHACHERLALGLGDFLKHQGWQPGGRAFCAVGARGVSFRRLRLPIVSRDELQRLLLMQMETEFPLPPDQLAWGWRLLNGHDRTSDASRGTQEILVVAMKQEALAEYAGILAGCGVKPIFTLAALARNELCSAQSGTHSVLDIGRTHSELACFEHGVPTAIRVLPWGGENITQLVRENLNVGADEAERLKLKLDADIVGDGELGRSIQASLETALEPLAGSLRGSLNGQQRLSLSGKSASCRELVPKLARLMGNGLLCERLESSPGPGRSAAILGLKRAVETGTGAPSLTIEAKAADLSVTEARSSPRQWAVLTAVLAVAVLALPYLEPLILKPVLMRKLAALKSDLVRTNVIDQELGFLQYLKQAQPPYSDALMVLANAGGARLDSLSMNRAGQIALRGAMQNSQQVTDFRSKLIASGFFANVSVDEQSPSPDRQRVNVRITAQWKPAGFRPESSTLNPSAKDIENARNSARGGPPGMPPQMGMPVMLDMSSGAEPPPGARAARGPRGARGARGSADGDGPPGVPPTSSPAQPPLP